MGYSRDSHHQPGLGNEVDGALDVVSSVISRLDPALLGGEDARVLYGSLVRLERLAMAGKALLAPRIAQSGLWRAEGHPNAASLLAALEGVSKGQARSTLELGRRLDRLPDTKAAVCAGRLSAPKAAELAGAGVLDPSHEGELLLGAEGETLAKVKERCGRSRARSARANPGDALRRIRAERSFSSWTDSEGAFCYQGKDTPDRGAQILDRIGRAAHRIRRQAQAAGVYEPERATRADAVFSLLGGGRDPGVGAGSAAGHSDGGEGSTSTDTGIDSPLSGSSSVVWRPPTCTAMVRVDLDALLRGRVEGEECCEIDGQGPIPVPLAQMMINDSLLRLVFVQGPDIRSIRHFGRTINAHLRTALAVRDRTCVVPGCGVSWHLEIDHVVPLEKGGPTAMDNLCLLCHHHHFLKTFEGWTLAPLDQGTDQPLRWRFDPPGPPRGGSRAGCGTGAGQLFTPG